MYFGLRMLRQLTLILIIVIVMTDVFVTIADINSSTCEDDAEEVAGPHRCTSIERRRPIRRLDHRLVLIAVSLRRRAFDPRYTSPRTAFILVNMYL